MKYLTRIFLISTFINVSVLGLPEDSMLLQNSQNDTRTEEEIRKADKENAQLAYAAKAVCVDKGHPIMTKTLEGLMKVGLYNYCDQYQDKARFCSCISEISYEENIETSEIEEFKEKLLEENRKSLMLESVKALTSYKEESQRAILTNLNKNKRSYPYSAPKCVNVKKLKQSIGSDCSTEDLQRMSDIFDEYSKSDSCANCKKTFSLGIVPRNRHHGDTKIDRFLSFPGVAVAKKMNVDFSNDLFKTSELSQIEGKRDRHSNNTINEIYEREVKQKLAQKIYEKWQGYTRTSYYFIDGESEKVKDFSLLKILERSNIMKGAKSAPKALGTHIMGPAGILSEVNHFVDEFEKQLEIDSAFDRKKVTKAEIMASLDEVFNKFGNEKLEAACETAIQTFKKSCKAMKDDSKMSFDFNQNVKAFREKAYPKKEDKFKFDQLYCVANKMATRSMVTGSTWIDKMKTGVPDLGIDLAGNGHPYINDKEDIGIEKIDFTTGVPDYYYDSMYTGKATGMIAVELPKDIFKNYMAEQNKESSKSDDIPSSEVDYGSYTIDYTGYPFSTSNKGDDKDYSEVNWNQKLSLGGNYSTGGSNDYLSRTFKFGSLQNYQEDLTPSAVDRFKMDVKTEGSDVSALGNDDKSSVSKNDSKAADEKVSTTTVVPESINTDEGLIGPVQPEVEAVNSNVASDSAEIAVASSNEGSESQEFSEAGNSNQDSVNGVANQGQFPTEGIDNALTNFNNNSNPQMQNFNSQFNRGREGQSNTIKAKGSDEQTTRELKERIGNRALATSESAEKVDSLSDSASDLEMEKLKLELEKMKLDLAKSKSELEKVSVESEEVKPAVEVAQQATQQVAPANTRRVPKKVSAVKKSSDTTRVSNNSSRGAASKGASVSSASNNSAFSQPATASSGSTTSSSTSSRASKESSGSTSGSGALLVATQAGDSQIFSSASKLEGNSFNSYAELESADQDQLGIMYEKFGTEVVVENVDGQETFELEKDLSTGEIKIVQKEAKRAPASVKEESTVPVVPTSRKRFSLEQFNRIIDSSQGN